MAYSNAGPVCSCMQLWLVLRSRDRHAAVCVCLCVHLEARQATSQAQVM